MLKFFAGLDSINYFSFDLCVCLKLAGSFLVLLG